MAQIGNIPEIIEIKNELAELKNKGVLNDWELPYENLLTRLDAAIFFLTPKSDSDLGKVWEVLGKNPKLRYQQNMEKSLSNLQWQVEFNDSNG